MYSSRGKGLICFKECPIKEAETGEIYWDFSKTRNEHKIWWEKFQGKLLLGRSRRRWTM
jgi:hypothetical protein